VTVLEDWSAIYAAELAGMPGFSPTDVDEAARSVNELIVRIDRAVG
jgi:hypothetical protein